MIVGVGVDVVDIDRFGAALQRTPSMRSRLFGEVEGQVAIESLAARFAAKEALAKALGATAELQWRDVDVGYDSAGTAVLRMGGSVAERADALGIARTHVSLAHNAGIATAFVVAEC